jgi:glucose/mannose-6-phosphate isomerase
MNLDDLERFRQLDSRDMLSQIGGLPEQLAAAWTEGQSHSLPSIDPGRISRVVIAGLGGSAIGGELIAAYSLPLSFVPIVVHRDYGLPAFARGFETLIIASSHSGNTEETLDSFDAALKAGCTVITVTTGGDLARRAAQHGTPSWIFTHAGQPRAAIGFSFGLLLALLTRLGVIPDPSSDLTEAIDAMRNVREKNGATVPAARNPAKRYAGQLMGRWVTVFGSGLMAPVARRLKTQINEIAKAGANFECIPEADHNALAGTHHPEDVLLPHTMSLFLRSPSDHSRNRRRLDLTKRVYMLEGLNTDFLDARGRSPLANMWTQILFGDYMAYYLAMGYGVDPTPVDALVQFKESMKSGS